MIVLNEELQGLGLEDAISHWYRGAVLIIKQLRPGTVIKDESMRLTADRAEEIAHWLRRLFKLPEFKTKKTRMGKVALISRRGIQYYSAGEKLIHLLGWPTADFSRDRT
jgi:hypothetical protein